MIKKSANLLLVDDDPSLLKLLGMRLSSEGFSVQTAESGRKRCDCCKGRRSTW